MQGKGAHKNKVHVVCQLACDLCGKHYDVKKSQVSSSSIHACCREHSNMLQRKGHAVYCLKRERASTSDNQAKLKNAYRRRAETNMRLYGVTCTLQAPDVLKKREASMLENYGVAHALQSPVLLAKMQKTMLDRHGVINPTQLPQNRDNMRIRIMERNAQGIGPSNKEKAFGDALETLYGTVERQVRVNNWQIDFYVPAVDTFVQYDGVYWHGIEERARVHEHVRQRMAIDAEQNQWFRKNQKTLIRFNERECEELMKDEKLVLLRETFDLRVHGERNAHTNL